MRMTISAFGDLVVKQFYEKLPESISALAAVVSTLGVWFVWRQLQFQKTIAQLQFEDGLAKEYRELASRIPTKALLGSGLSPREYRDAFDELFRYIDLSNEQVLLRMSGRVGDSTWRNWNSGIKYNLSLPAFKRAWETVQTKNPEQFSELRTLVEKGFCDPMRWDKKRWDKKG